MSDAVTVLIGYRVVIDTPKGMFDVDVLGSQGSEAAGRRAWMTVVHARTFGDIDEIHVQSVQEICGWFAGCDNIADGHAVHPFLGELPICNTCLKLVNAK